MAEYNPYSDGMQPGDWTTTVRRVVTGLNDSGDSAIVWDEQNPHRNVGHSHPGYVITNIWRTEAAPADNTSELRDPWVSDEPLSIGPTATGSVFRYLELPPDADWRFDAEGKEIEPLAFHTTNSIDYAIVLKGEIWAVMDAGETLLRPGDVLIQRGTHHAWSNRSADPALLAFILVGAEAASSGRE